MFVQHMKLQLEFTNRTMKGEDSKKVAKELGLNLVYPI